MIAQKNDSTIPETISIGLKHTLKSEILSEERILNIYLPEGYNSQDTLNYPVIYLLDGSIDEDFIHVSGLVQFLNLPWVNMLQPSILVGIANVDRKRDFTFPSTVEENRTNLPTSGKSSTFISFLENEAIPFIEKTYNTNNKKTIIGQSLGGLLATEILFYQPELFDTYIIISPSIWWDNASLLLAEPRILDSTYLKQTAIYIGVGKEGLASCTIPHVMEVDANLLHEKISSSKSKHIQSYFDYLPMENHATITHQALYNAFRMLQNH